MVLDHEYAALTALSLVVDGSVLAALQPPVWVLTALQLEQICVDSVHHKHGVRRLSGSGVHSAKLAQSQVFSGHKRLESNLDLVR